MAGASKRLVSRFLKTEDWPLPHRTISPVDDQSPEREVLVVPIQHPEPRTPVQELPSVAMPARDQEALGPYPGTRSHQNRGAARRRAVQPNGSSFSRNYRCHEDVRPTGGRGRRRSGQGERGTQGATRIAERGRGEAGGGGLGG